MATGLTSTLVPMRLRSWLLLASTTVMGCAGPSTRPAPSIVVWSRPPDPAAQLLATPKVTRQVRHFAADASHRVLVTATVDDRLAIVRDGEERSWQLKALMQSGDCALPVAILGSIRVGVSLDGAEAWFVGINGNKRQPTYVLSAACIVDIETGIARSLRSELGQSQLLPKLDSEFHGLGSILLTPRFAVTWAGEWGNPELVWRDTHVIESLDMGSAGGNCAAAAIGSELTVACVRAKWIVRLARFDVSTAPHQIIASRDLRVRAPYPYIQLSADGRFLAFHDPPRASTAFMGVIDTADGHSTYEVNADSPVHAVDFVPGSDTVLLAHKGGSVRLLGVDGRVHTSFRLDCLDPTLIATGNRRVWCNGPEGLGLYGY